MKKTLAIFLFAVLTLALAVTCFVIVASAATNDGGPTDAQIDAKALATQLYVVTDASKAGGTTATDANGSIVLSASNPSVTLSSPASGTLSFNAQTGVLTMTNVSGVASIQSWTGSFTVNVVGTNNITSTAGRGIFARSTSNNGGVTITSSTNGVLNMNVASYIVYSNDGHVRFNGNVVVNIENAGTAAAVQANQSGSDHGSVIVAENAVLNVTSSVQAIHVNGANGGIFLRDNAVVKATATASSGNRYALQGQNNAPVSVSDNAVLIASAPSGTAVNCGTLKINGGYASLSGGNNAVTGTVAGATIAADAKTATVNAGDLTEIAVTMADNSVVNLYENTNLNSVVAGSGKITYAAGTDTLTFDNATGVKAVSIKNNPVSIELKGSSALTGDGITSDNALTVKGTGSVAFSGAKAFTVTGNLTVQDSVVISGTVTGAAVTVKGEKMTVKDTASLTLTSTGGTGIYLCPTSGATEFEALDASTVYMKASSVALYISAKTNNTVTITTTGNTYFERSANANGAAFYLNAGSATGDSVVTIKNGVCNVVGYSQGANNGVMNVGNNAATRKSKTTVTVKDATLNVTENYTSSSTENNVIRLNGTDGSAFNVEGDAVVNVVMSSTKTGSVKTRAIYSFGVDINVSDDAVLSASVNAPTPAATEGAITISDADVTVDDDAILSASCGNGGYAIAITGGKVALEGGLSKLYGAAGAVTTGSVTMASGAKVQAGDSPDGALADIDNTFPYASKYVQVNIGNVVDAPSVSVTLSDNSVVTLLRNAPWNTVKAGSGSVTYKDGVLTLDNATAKGIAVSGAALQINVKGTNTLSGDGISSDRNIAVTGDTLNFTGTSAFVLPGTLTLSDDLVVSANVTGVAIALDGTNPGLVVTDNVDLTVKSTTHGISIKAATTGTATFILSDAAEADVNTTGVALYFERSGEAVVSLTSSGTSVFHRTGDNASFFLSNSKKNTIEVKNGDYTFSGRGGNNHNAVFRIDGGNPTGVDGYNGTPCDIDFVIEDANVTVERISNNSVSMGMRLFGKDGSALKILGDSTVTVDAPSNISNADISAIYADNVDIIVSGNSTLSAAARGINTSSSAASTSGAIRLVNADLTVEGNGEAEASAPKGGSGISVTNGKINLKGGTLDVTGAPAINNASALKVAVDAVIKTGDDRVNAKAVDSYTNEAYALIKTEDAHEFVDISVTLADNTKHTFSRKADILTWNKGEITYDYANGVLILDNATDVKALVIGEGDLDVKLVGKSEIVNVGSNALNTSLNGGILKFVGNGELTLDSDKSAALQASGTGGQWIFAEKVKVVAYSPSSSLRTSGPDVAIIVTDEAEVMAAGNRDADYGAIYAYATKSALVEATGKSILRVVDNTNAINVVAPNAVLRASENAVLVGSGTRFGAYVHTDNANGVALIEATGNAEMELNAGGLTEFQSGWTYAAAYVTVGGDNGEATVKASDNAQLRMIGADKYIAGQIKASKNVANLIVEDSAEVIAENSGTATLWLNAAKEINTSITTDKGITVKRGGNANGAAFYLQPAAADTVINVDIKNGVANFIGSSGGTNNGVVNIGYNAADPRSEKVNINIKDAYVAVSNYYTGGTAQSVGLRVFAAEGSMKVHGNSVLVVNVYSSKSGSALYGLYDAGVDVELFDTSMAYIATEGVNASASGAALSLCDADMTVSDRVELDALSNDGGYGASITAGNNIYFKGGISEFFGTAVTDNILAMKRGENVKVYTGDSVDTATDDFRTFSGLEKYARINVGNLTERPMILVTDADYATKILTAAPWNTLVQDPGYLSYDAATRTLTMSDASVIKIHAPNGDLSVVLDGASRITSSGPYGIVVGTGDLTVKGKGTLDIETKGYALAALKGDMTVTGDVTVTATGTGPVIFVDGEASNLTFSGNAKVTATGTGAAIIRNASPSGFSYVKDNAHVIVINGEPGSWGSAFDTSNFEITGGILDLTASGSKNTAFVGMAVSVQKAEMEAGAKAGVANFKGGKVIVNVKNDSAVEDKETKKVADSRGYGLFFKNLEEINFAGSDIDIAVVNKTGTVDAQKVNNRAAITWQSDNGVATVVTLTAGTLKISADKNTAGILASAANSTFVMKGGSLLGEAATLFAAAASGTKYTINGGMVDFKAHGSIVGTASKPTVKVNASILKGAADTESKILVIGNPATVALPVAIITVTALCALAAAALIVYKRRKSAI